MEKSISLYNKDNGSDKVYNIILVKSGDGFVVNYQNGRAGSTLVNGTKTPGGPIPLADAEKIYEKLLKEKTKGGYKLKEGSEAAEYSNVDVAIAKEVILLPQLLNDVYEAESYINDDSYLMQFKEDGERRILIKEKEKTIGLNKKGTEVPLPISVINSIKTICTLDGEMVGDKLFVFDIISCTGEDIRSKSCIERVKLLNVISTSLGEGIEVVRTAYTKAEKQAMYDEAIATNREGVVFKKKDAPYESGRPASGGNCLKNKFYKTATFIVRDITKGKRSIGLDIIDGDKRIHIGKCTIPPNKEIPAIGALVEVRYLYCYKGGCIFQPNYKEERHDSDLSDATIKQIIYKAE